MKSESSGEMKAHESLISKIRNAKRGNCSDIRREKSLPGTSADADARRKQPNTKKKLLGGHEITGFPVRRRCVRLDKLLEVTRSCVIQLFSQYSRVLVLLRHLRWSISSLFWLNLTYPSRKEPIERWVRSLEGEWVNYMPVTFQRTSQTCSC